MRNEWDLTIIYKNEKEYKEDLESFYEDIKKLESLKGKLNSKEGFELFAKYQRNADSKLDKLFTYASMKHDLNQKDNVANIDYQRIYSVYNEYLSRTSFINPEILSNGLEKIENILKESEVLKVYDFSLIQLFRSQKYFLDAKSEGLIANFGEVKSGYNGLYDKLAVSDNNSVIVKLSTGKKLELNESNFQYYLEITLNQDDRRIIFEAIYKFYENHRNTFAAIYNGIMQSELSEVKNRGYASILESHLYYSAIPTDVFNSLIASARNNTKPLKRYLDIRKKYFKLNTIHTYDRFLQFAASDKEYDYETSKKMVLDACSALGNDFLDHAKKALEDGRVSVFTKDGKRTGAYSTSLYNEGTFILLNHNNNLESAFTIAHEAGHSIHSLYSNENQVYEKAGYKIFVAEIASTFNEQLFLDYIMKNSNSKEEKICILQKAIDNIVSTFYRQTLFANYEALAHELVEKKEPVTADSLSSIMVDLYNHYYGIDLNNEPYKNNVWAYIPHFFHSPFYVYQYATSFAASLAIYQNVKNNVPNSLDKYLNMLKMGGSNYPVEIVKAAGVDLTKTDAFLAVVTRMDELLDQLEELIK